MQEKFWLKSEKFHENLVKFFQDLKDIKLFADVTLVSDDQIQNQAHKIVLSASSPVLRNILINNSHTHPILYLRGIKQTELEAILKYIYSGETLIYEERFNDFVRAANDFQLEDLNLNEEEGGTLQENENNKEVNQDIKIKQGNPETDTENKDFNFVPIHSKKLIENSSDLVATDQDQISNDKFKDDETLIQNKSIEEENHEVKATKDPATSCKNLANRRLDRIYFSTEGSFSCEKCGATYADAYRLRRHKQSVHEGKSQFHFIFMGIYIILYIQV